MINSHILKCPKLWKRYNGSQLIKLAMNKNTIFATVLVICLTGLLSCETDKSRTEKCDNIIQSFIGNLSLDNYDQLNKYYPDFSRIKRYWKAQDFKIQNTTIDDEKTVSVFGSSSQGNIMFILQQKNGNYVITKSKGLSSVFQSNLYKYCKAIGCVGEKSYDADLSELCSEKESEFNALVYKIKSEIESNFIIKNNNLSNNYGYVSGDVTTKNNSRFTIPADSYEIYYSFKNSNGYVVFTKKQEFTLRTIAYGQSITEQLFESNTRNFASIDVELKIISTDFIERVIAEHIKGANCIAGNIE